MNRYPVWKYVILVVALLLGVVYTLPNFFGEAPAVQVSSAKATIKVDTSTLQKVEDALKTAGTTPQSVVLEGTSIRARFENTDQQQVFIGGIVGGNLNGQLGNPVMYLLFGEEYMF